jgi:3-keto-disaccharide hydrolase
MKIHRIVFAFTTVILLAVAAHSQNEKSATDSSSDSAKAYLGRWDLTLKAPDREYPSWLELREENGQLKAQMVGRWGNARPLPSAELSNGHLKFVSPKEEEDSKTDMVFEGTLTGKILSGTANAPDGKTWQWTGRRAPSLKRASPPNWASPIPLFNGKDLTGWREDKPGVSPVWKVENGILVRPDRGPELINSSNFEDFKLHVEFNCGPDSNSGVYLRGRYEVQIETDSASDPPSRRMGGVYGFLAPSPEPARTPDQWQTYDITLTGRLITLVLNGKTIIDNKEIPGITGGALDSHEELPGPIYLQGTEKGHVMFRSIVITPATK